jgi:CRISPR system Cascade subunit CasC
MLIQMHFLQNYAPANLNRDDTGAPKDAIFGGLLRGRISSQCLKRSIRTSETFNEAFAANGLLGKRTKRLPGQIQKELTAMGADEGAIQAIVTRVSEIGRKAAQSEGEGQDQTGSDETGVPETRQLIFLGQDELRPLADKLLALYQEQGAKKFAKFPIDKLEEALQHDLPRSVDIAMFGRMTTSAAFEDVWAAVQVAHALSTNALTQEFDYYTAVDDLSGESGAGMIGDVEFNSSTYYKYLNVHWEQLLENLGGDVAIARQSVLALLEAAATAQPSGKQNSFAAHCLPDLILVEVQAKNLPVSYANAFLKPARPWGEETLVDASVRQLADYIARLSKTYSLNGQRAFTATQDYSLPQAEEMDSLANLQTWLAAQLPE